MDGADQLVVGVHDRAVLCAAAHGQHGREVESADDLGGVEGCDLGVGLLPKQLAAVHP